MSDSQGGAYISGHQDVSPAERLRLFREHLAGLRQSLRHVVSNTEIPDLPYALNATHNIALRAVGVFGAPAGEVAELIPFGGAQQPQ